MELDIKIKRMRKELDNYVLKYGLSDNRTLTKSQELDKLIAIKQVQLF
ncbi:aspartyl-phosphate phosphatase Spo0E family protein [Hathewaya massiliensis]|nr:aspartyl-phosphate phosphatase Spo0E family protein [Hathewaya massiliensis]